MLVCERESREREIYTYKKVSKRERLKSNREIKK